MTDLKFEIRYSKRRKKTLSAVLRNNTFIISAPQNINKKILDDFIKKIKRKYVVSLENKKIDLKELSLKLMKKYFSKSIRDKIGDDFVITFVSTQKRVLGVCNYTNRSIRLSDVLIPLPDWVKNYVILHELAHFIEPNHSKKFWEIVNNYPYVEKAKSFVQGLFFGVSHYKEFLSFKTFDL